jgi:hypothetical protein
MSLPGESIPRPPEQGSIPMLWQGLSVNQRPSNGTDYPFLSPSADIRYLIGDLYLSILGHVACGKSLPLRVSWLYGFGAATGGPTTPVATHTRDIQIKDQAGVVVFDSRVGSYTEQDWNDSLSVIIWETETGILRLTRRKTWPPFVTTPPTVPRSIAPTNGVLDPRAYTVNPNRVESFVHGLHRTTPTGRLRLVAGHNIDLQIATSARGVRRVNTITMRARPGDGLGRVDGCDGAEVLVRRVNAVSPTPPGDLTLEADDCLRLQRKVTATTASPARYTFATPADRASLVLHNDCTKPCCSCDDYVAVYESIRKVYTKYQTLGARFDATVLQHRANIDRYSAAKACRVNNALRLVAQGEAYGGLFIAGAWCNVSLGCVRPVVLRVLIEPLRDGDPVSYASCVDFRCDQAWRLGSDTGGRELVYVPYGSYPMYDIFFERVDPQAVSKFRMRLRFPCAQDGDSVRITLSAHTGPSVDGRTQRLIALPQQTPDTALAAAWAARPLAYEARDILTQIVTVGPNANCGVCELEP